jgi:PAS domain S-box-containing protein
MISNQELFNRQIPAMMHSIDAEGRIVAVSQKWLDVMGYSEEEVLGRRSTEFMTEESCLHARENVLPEFFRTGSCSDISYQMVTKQGGIIDVLLSATSKRDALGNISHSLAVMQDVSALNATRQSMERAKQRLEMLLQTANVMVVELDQQGNLIRLNEISEQITGYKMSDLVGQNWFNTIAPRQRYPHVWEEFERLVSIGKTGEFENPILTREGHERYIAWRNSSIFEGGQVVGTLSVGIDITELKNAEHRLSYSEAALNDAQTLAQIGNWSFDYDSKQLHWSAQIYELLEVPRDVAPSKAAFLRVLHPEDYTAIKDAYKRCLRLHQPYELRYRLLFPNGNLKYVRQLTQIQFAINGNPSCLVSTMQDITLQMLQELSIQESETRFRTIADYTYDWEYWRGNDKEILYISPSCLRVTGYSQADFIRDPDLIEKIIHPEDLHSFKSHLLEILDSEENHLQFRIIAKNGEERIQ